MKNELFPFQKLAVWDMRKKTAWTLDAYRRTGTPQIKPLDFNKGVIREKVIRAATPRGTQQYLRH